MLSATLLPTIPSSTSRILTHGHSPTILPHFQYSLKLLTKSRTNFRPPLRKSHPPRASPVGSSDPFLTNEPPVDKARAAISDFLRGYGVLQSDADEIFLKSPRFLKMVVDGVSELEELLLWGSWGGGSVETMSFKEKVGHMMEEKSHGGKVAFLESVGLSLSSAMNVSRIEKWKTK